MRAYFAALMLLFFLMGLSANSSAQSLGSITGTVLDAQTGQALPGVNVLLTGTGLGATTSGRWPL